MIAVTAATTKDFFLSWVAWSTWPVTFQNKFSFAALLADGSVVTWGDRSYGGDSRRVQPELVNVRSGGPAWPSEWLGMVKSTDPNG